MEKVFFDPRIGSCYNSGIHDKKVMVLGHVHVCGECNECGNLTERGECARFTINVVDDYFKWRKTGEIPSPGYEGWLKTFFNFAKAFFGYEPSIEEEQDELWNRVIFYNYVQSSVSDWHAKPTYEEYEKSKVAFLEVINELEPDIIIAWGNGAYNNTSDGGENDTPLVFENIKSDRKIYTLNSGKKCTLMKIHHPSMYFSWSRWHEIIKQAL